MTHNSQAAPLPRPFDPSALPLTIPIPQNGAGCREIPRNVERQLTPPAASPSTAEAPLPSRADPTNHSFSCSSLSPPVLSPPRVLALGSLAPCAGSHDPSLAMGTQGAAKHQRLCSCSLGVPAGSWCGSLAAQVPARLMWDGWGRQGLASALPAPGLPAAGLWA